MDSKTFFLVSSMLAFAASSGLLKWLRNFIISGLSRPSFQPKFTITKA